MYNKTYLGFQKNNLPEMSWVFWFKIKGFYFQDLVNIEKGSAYIWIVSAFKKLNIEKKLCTVKINNKLIIRWNKTS